MPFRFWDMFSRCHPIHSLAASAFLGGWDDLHTYVVRELSLSAGERGCVRVAQVAVTGKHEIPGRSDS